ncbi:hypothetical protein ACFE04_029744 [Oxalis oulophora]
MLPSKLAWHISNYIFRKSTLKPNCKAPRMNAIKSSSIRPCASGNCCQVYQAQLFLIKAMHVSHPRWAENESGGEIERRELPWNVCTAFVENACIDKVIRLARRFPRDDPNYDAMILVLSESIDKCEAELKTFLSSHYQLDPSKREIRSVKISPVQGIVRPPIGWSNPNSSSD